MNSSLYVSCLLCLVKVASVGAFVVPRALGTTARQQRNVDKAASVGQEAYLFPPSLTIISDDASAIEAISSNPIFDAVKTVLVILTAGAFALFGLSYVFAAVLIPKAAEQLEREAKELAPDLWEEYQARLGPGETMATRPDLLQELGNKIQPLIDQKIVRETQAQQQRQQQQENQSSSASANKNDMSSAAIDAEIVKDEEHK